MPSEAVTREEVNDMLLVAIDASLEEVRSMNAYVTSDNLVHASVFFTKGKVKYVKGAWFTKEQSDALAFELSRKAP